MSGSFRETLFVSFLLEHAKLTNQ